MSFERIVWVSGLCLMLAACGEPIDDELADETSTQATLGGDGDGDGDPGTNGDGDPETSGDGDPDSTGDGDPETSGDGDGDGSGDGDGEGSGDGDGEPGGASPGCGLAQLDPAGGVQLAIDAGPAGDGMRGYYLSVPDDYDPNHPYAIVVGYAGTNWTGSMIEPYLDLESSSVPLDAIYVYPDPLWRDFPGWGNLGGWVLGEHASPANGMGDLVFTEVLLDHLEANYCIDTGRVFATGHSWGGDMAAVASCFLGDRFTASVPVAANRPYWFEPNGGGVVNCSKNTAVWTMFGIADDHFNWQDYPGQFGDEQRDFWTADHNCDMNQPPIELEWGAEGECLEYQGCDSRVLYCLYGPASGHQIPSYYTDAAVTLFSMF